MTRDTYLLFVQILPQAVEASLATDSSCAVLWAQECIKQGMNEWRSMSTYLDK